MTDQSRSLSRRRLIGTTVAAAAVMSTADLATASADDRSSTRTGSLDPDKGLPTLVDPVKDLFGHTGGSEPSWLDGIYFTSQLDVDGDEYGLLVATGKLPGNGGSMTTTVTNQTTGWHDSFQTLVSEDDYTWDTGKLNIELPRLSWTGDSKKMLVKADTDWGSVDLVLEPQGPALIYVGSGVWPMLGANQSEFAYPAMKTTGTLTVQGKTHQVTGESWLDRQWGALPASNWRWTWMNLSLSNGDKVAIWDVLDDSAENAFATVLHPDGSYDLAAVKPLAEDADNVWTSPTSGNAYPTRWLVEIPSLNTRLNVDITGEQDQELTGASIPARMDITAKATGVHLGKRVTGKTYVEMVGNWKA